MVRFERLHGERMLMCTALGNMREGKKINVLLRESLGKTSTNIHFPLCNWLQGEASLPCEMRQVLSWSLLLILSTSPTSLDTHTHTQRLDKAKPRKPWAGLPFCWPPLYKRLSFETLNFQTRLVQWQRQSGISWDSSCPISLYWELNCCYLILAMRHKFKIPVPLLLTADRRGRQEVKNSKLSTAIRVKKLLVTAGSPWRPR